MEELRMELRSLLLSSKHGIPTHEIESHYEDIIGKRLDYRKFNFQSVIDLMHAMPDVARLDSTGEVYHALSDESTAHIKKMVMRQKTKPIKVGRGRGGRGRGRGRGGRGRGHFRGGYMSARGAGHFTTRGAGHFTTRGTGHAYYRGTGHMLARGASHMSARAAGHFSARGNGPEPARGPGFGGNQSYGFSGYLKQHSQNDQIPFGHNSQKGTVVTLRSTYSPTYSESNRLEETENVPIIPQRSPMKNLQINISPGGSRVIMADKPDPKPSDLREYLKEKKIKLEQNNKNDNCQNYPQFQHSQYKKELPPRFMKANADRSQGNNADKVLVFQKTSSVVHDIKTKNASQGYVEEKVVHTIESQNWEVPENGEEYLLAFKDYFASRGEEPPPIEIVEGKVSKQNGFYGRLRYNGLMYYPLVILHTRQHAEWMAAKAFCTQNNITLPVPSVEPQSPDKQVNHSEIQPSKSVVLSPVIVQSHSDHIQFNSPQPSNPVIQTPVSSLTEQENMDIVHKLYMMLKDKEFGVFLKYLPSLYVEIYNEELPVDLKSFLLNFPDFFSVEDPSPNRFIVYTVPDALNKTKACSASTEVMPMDYPRVPPCHLPKVGDVVKGTIVFVYSPDEFYFRDINTEDTMQALEEMLNTIYSKADVPDVKSLAVNSFVIGQYLEGWYRAQVKKIDENVIVVSYIDYGNSEEVTLEDLRCLPTEDLIVNTPALAIKCALRKHQDAVGWVPDAEQQLQSLQDSSVTMTVISLTDDVCNCHLYHMSGFCINENITIMPTVQNSPSPPSDMVASPSPPSDMVASPPSSTQPAPVSPASKTEETLLPPSTTISTPAVQQSPACSVVSSSSVSSSASKSKGKVHFTPDPNSLAIPEKDAEIAIYICDVLSECCVILRFVDDNFSDKLDELENEIADQFDSWPVPAEVKLSNVYAAAVDTDPDEFEEEEEEDVECEECKRYHRVRVIRKEKDQYYCFFPDHGDFMTLEKCDLREIDSKLNISLPFQAVVASLEGLDSLPSELKHFAKRCLQKLLFLDDSHSFVAVVTDKLIMESRREDTYLLRVRKIISCLDKVEVDKVKQIYKDIYKEPCEDVAELLKELPGFGSWKEHLHINIYNTEQDDEDVLINEVILDAINDVEEGQDALDVFNTLFGTSYKSFEEMDEDENEEEEEEEEADKVNSDALQHEEKEEPVISSPLGRPQTGTLPVKRLYTWNSEAYKIAQEKVTVKQTVYKFWTYPLMTSSAIIIISVESPSHFVGIPAEPALEFEKMLVEVNQALSESSVRPDRLEENHLYAVKMEDGFHRALFRQRIGQQGCKTYLPDTCQHEVVPSDQLFILPERFAAMPFLANRMSLGGVKPIGPTWSQEAKEWFYKQTYKKVLYALVVREEHIHNDLPPVLVVHLIDTSSEEDILLDDQMVEKLMAVKTC